MSTTTTTTTTTIIIIAVISKTLYLTDEGEYTVIYKIKNDLKPPNNIES